MRARGSAQGQSCGEGCRVRVRGRACAVWPPGAAAARCCSATEESHSAPGASALRAGVRRSCACGSIAGVAYWRGACVAAGVAWSPRPAPATRPATAGRRPPGSGCCAPSPSSARSVKCAERWARQTFWIQSRGVSRPVQTGPGWMPSSGCRGAIRNPRSERRSSSCWPLRATWSAATTPTWTGSNAPIRPTSTAARAFAPRAARFGREIYF